MAKLTAAGPIEREERGQVTDVEQKQDIPFGVRCLENGVDVEGVWSSNANTPLQSPKSSAPSSPRLGPTTDAQAIMTTSRESRESRRSTSRAKLEKRPKRVAKPQPDEKDQGQTSTRLFGDVSLSVHKGLANEQLESRKSPILETMRGRPAWQPHRYRTGHYPHSRSAGNSMDFNSNSPAFNPESKAGVGKLVEIGHASFKFVSLSNSDMT